MPKTDPNPLAMIPLDEITVSELNPRKHIDQERLDELTASIKQVGMISPILVSPAPDNGEGYIVVAGHRRVLAAAAAGLDKVPAYITNGDGAELSEVRSLAENVIREDLSPLEEASAYALLLDQHGDPDRVAALVGKDVRTVKSRLQLLTLPDDIRTSIGLSIPLGCADHLARIASQSEDLARACADEISAERESQLQFPDLPTTVIDYVLEEGETMMAWSHGGWGDPRLPREGRSSGADPEAILAWMGNDGRWAKAWDALGDLPAPDPGGYSYERASAIRRRIDHVVDGITEEMLDAARAYGCLLEWPDESGKQRYYLTDPAWCDDHLGGVLEGYTPPPVPSPSSGRGGRENRSQTAETGDQPSAADRRKAEADEAYELRVAARGRNLSVGAACAKYQAKPTLDEAKILALIVLEHEGEAAAWAHRLCREWEVKVAKTTGKETVVYPRGYEERSKLLNEAVEAVERAKTVAEVLSIPLRLLVSQHLVDTSGLVGADREGVYEQINLQRDPRLEKLANRVAPAAVKKAREEKRGV